MEKANQCIGWPVFKEINSCCVEELNIGEIVFVDEFFMTDNSENICKLALTPTHLVIIINGEVSSSVIIDFELKFQVIYSLNHNIQSQKTGFRLYHNYNSKISFSSSNIAKVNLWLLFLASKINQRGFHQLFQPIRKIGKGNFAAVYQVIRLEDQKHFAVKAFSKTNSFSAKNGKQSLISELNILRKLNHKNTIHLEGVYQSENSIYVVLEILEGGQLLSLISQKGGPFSDAQTKEFMIGLLKGLQHIHNLRIMHRDLKPQNILLRNKQSMDPVIVDFGLATFVDLEKYLFFRCGTPGYVAPQIMKLTKNEHIEPQCDVFSAGAIFHILLTGKPLFPGQNYDEVYRKNRHLCFKLNDLSHKNIHPYALDLLARMLEQDPIKRIKPSEALNHFYFAEQSTQSNQTLMQQSKNGFY